MVGSIGVLSVIGTGPVGIVAAATIVGVGLFPAAYHLFHDFAIPTVLFVPTVPQIPLWALMPITSQPKPPEMVKSKAKLFQMDQELVLATVLLLIVNIACIYFLVTLQKKATAKRNKLTQGYNSRGRKRHKRLKSKSSSSESKSLKNRTPKYSNKSSK